MKIDFDTGRGKLLDVIDVNFVYNLFIYYFLFFLVFYITEMAGFAVPFKVVVIDNASLCDVLYLFNLF